MQRVRTSRSQQTPTSWWWPLLLLVGLGITLFLQLKDKKDDDDSNLATNIKTRYYLQNPYLVVDVPIPKTANEVGFVNGGDKDNRISLEDLPAPYEVPGKEAKVFLEKVKLADDSEQLRVWHPVSAFDPDKFNEARNKALGAFNGLNISFWKVKDKDAKVKDEDAKRLANVTAVIPDVGNISSIDDLIKDVDVPWGVAEGITEDMEKDFPGKFDFGLKATLSDVEAPFWTLTYTPPHSVTGQTKVDVFPIRYHIEPGGSKVEEQLSAPTTPTQGTFTLPATEDPPHESNVFVVLFKRGDNVVGADLVKTCDEQEDPDCEKILKFINAEPASLSKARAFASHSRRYNPTYKTRAF